MTKELANRVRELQLIGWSEDNSKLYAEKFSEKGNYNFELSFDFIFLLTLFIFLILIIIYLINYRIKTKSNIILKQKENLVLDKLDFDSFSIQESFQSSQKSLAEAKTRNPKEPIVKYIIDNFKDTSVDTHLTLEYILLIFMLSFEALINVANLFNRQSNLLEYSGIANSSEKINSDFEKRKEALMKKKNTDLRFLLGSMPRVSRLNKAELVERILQLEFKS